MYKGKVFVSDRRRRVPRCRDMRAFMEQVAILHHSAFA